MTHSRAEPIKVLPNLDKRVPVPPPWALRLRVMYILADWR